MPVYTYECEHCGERFEAKQSFNDSPLTICPTCEGKLHRVIQPAGIVFKGSGFYVNDSRSKQNLATSGKSKDDAKETTAKDSKDTKAASSETSSAPASTTTSSKESAPAKSAEPSTAS